MGLGSDKGMVLPSLKEAMSRLFLKQPYSPSNDNCPGSSDDLGQLSSNFQLSFLGEGDREVDCTAASENSAETDYLDVFQSRFRLRYGTENTLCTL